MRFAAVILTVAVLAAVGRAAERDLAGGMEFAAALIEEDAVKRAGMLLSAAEREGYPADLALIYLTRSRLDSKLTPRLVKLAERRRGELIPALLAVRASDANDASAHAPALEAWRAAARRKELSDFETPFFRELSGFVLESFRCSEECASVRTELEELIRRHPHDWRRLLPPVAVLRFYYSCAFRASGFEPVSPAWSESPHPECRAFVQLLRELLSYVPDNGAEAEALVRFHLLSGGEKAALTTALEFARRHTSQAALGMLIFAASEAGAPDIFDTLKDMIKPESLPVLKCTACIKSGDFVRAEQLLAEVPFPAARARLELKLLSAKGDFRGAAEAVLNHPAGIPERERILALLAAAEYGAEARYYREAEKLMTPAAWKDPWLSNAFGFVALELGFDLTEAERRIRLAVELDPGNSAYLDSMAMVRFKLGDRAGAWKWMSRALAMLEPYWSSCEILEHAGDIQMALGDRTRAAEFYRTAFVLARRGSEQPDGANCRRLAARIAAKMEAAK